MSGRENQMQPLKAWLDEYGESHRNPVNKTLHRICVPVIVLSVLGLLRALPLGGEWINAATLGALLALLYYLWLSWRLALGMLLAFALIYLLVEAIYHYLPGAGLPLMVALFVVAWIGQFIGHRVEGKKPSFFKDVQFLLIGPLWLLADLYRRLALDIGGGALAQH